MSALWRTGLLLSILCFNASRGEECVLGIIGKPTLLHCIYDGAVELDSLNVSIEWRRDNEVVHRSVWGEGLIKTWSGLNSNSTGVTAEAPQTGNLSLELSNVEPTDSQNYSVYLIVLGGEEQSSPVCSVCLWTAASFTHPILQREDSTEGAETRLCHSRGGFPVPAVHWLINETEQPPEASVRTHSAPLPDSQLFNITSHLIVNASRHTSVSCIIENLLMNQILTSTSYGVQNSPVVGRAAESMWIICTALSVVVGVMVLAGVVYQIYDDRSHKRKYHSDTGEKEDCEENQETELVKVEQVDIFTETNV